MEMRTNEQVRTHPGVGSGELSGENLEELSAQHLMLQMTNDKDLMTRRN
jgi:hypothetical protein